MSSYDDDDIQFDFFDEPETVEATQRRRLPRLERNPDRGGGGDRPPRPPRSPGGGGGAPGIVPLARLVGLIAIAIAIIVGLVFWVGSCEGKSKHDTYASYAAQVRTISDADKRLGAKLISALQTKLKQSDLETSLAQFAQQEQQEYTQAQAIRPPGPLRPAHERLLDAIELRAKGLAGMSSVLAQAGANASKSGTASNTTTVDQLAAQGNLLTASDIVWKQLYQQPATQTLTQQGVTGVVIPASQFVPTADDVSTRAFSIVMEHLSGASTGGTPTGLHGDSLVGVHVSPQGADLSTSSATNVQVSADLTFTVTAENSGDFDESGVVVTLKIDSGSVHIKRTKTIPLIKVKGQESVDFNNFDLPPDAFANQAKVTATVAKVPGEHNLTNNSATYPVFFTLVGG